MMVSRFSTWRDFWEGASLDEITGQPGPR
jgi:hypothetical protein